MIVTVYVMMTDGVKHEIHLVKCYECHDIYTLNSVEEVIIGDGLSALICWRCTCDEPRQSPNADYLSRWEDTSSPPSDASS